MLFFSTKDVVYITFSAKRIAFLCLKCIVPGEIVSSLVKLCYRYYFKGYGSEQHLLNQKQPSFVL